MIENWKEYNYDGKNIKIRKTDGYINATQLCKAGNRMFKKWHENIRSQEFLEELSKTKQLSIENLVQITIDGENENRGTWVHPQVATYIAQWISPKFAVKVSDWIEEWKNSSNENKKVYCGELEHLSSYNKMQIEKEIQQKLQKSLDAQIEVETPIGYIDILTDTQIIEIKNITHWKSALGQILSYGSFYPEHQKILYLFNKTESKIDTIQIENICKKYQIEVRYDN